MCGRYATTRSTAQLRDTFMVAADHADEVTRQDYNMAPTKRAPIVLSAVPPDTETDATPRQIRLAIWGLRPGWMTDPKARGLTNARAETINEKRSFRRPFEHRRCIVPADGFYEWFTDQAVDGNKPAKQPYFFRPADGGVLGMAGVVDYWRAPDTELWIPTYTIITTTATDDAGMVHDRMPMIITPDRWDDWLDPTLTSPAEARALMAPPQPGTLDIYPVSTAVNTVKNNGPSLIERIELAA